MSKEVAEVPTDPTAEQSYEEFVAETRAGDQPPAEKEPEASAAEQAQSGAESEPAKKEPSPEPEEEPEPKWTPAQQKRFDRLTREKYELQGLTKAQEAELIRLRAQQAEKKPEAAAAAREPEYTGEPRQDDVQPDGTPKYPTFEDYNRAFIAHTVSQAKVEWQREAAEAAARKEFQAAEDVFRKTHKDYDQAAIAVRDQFEPRPNKVVEYTVTALEHSQALVHYLGTHPAEFQSILRMPDNLAVAEIGAIHDRIRTSLKGSPSPEKILPKKTGSPPPPGRVTGSSAETSLEDAAEYEDFARGEDAKRKRR